MNGQLLRIFLASGDVNGPVYISLANKSLSAILLSRTSVPAFLHEAESKKPGVYILIGGLDDTEVYIGQASPVGNRIQQHLLTKNYWETAFVFTSNDAYFSRQQILSIEAKLIELIRKDAVHLHNCKKESMPLLSKADSNEIENYVSDILLVMNLFRRHYFHNPNTISLVDKLNRNRPESHPPLHTDSRAEQEFISLLEHTALPIKWVRPTYRQFHLHWSEGNRLYSYVPDFILETPTNGYLIEIMNPLPLAKLHSKLKQSLAQKYCDGLNESLPQDGGIRWRYKSIDASRLFSNSSLEKLLDDTEDTDE